jgi:hypothetical protein
MTTTTVFGDAEDALIYSNGAASYSDAREGSGGASLTKHTSYSIWVGQYYSGSTYECYEPMVAFDTSSIPDSDGVSAVILGLVSHLDTDVDSSFIMEARLHDWGSTSETADWVAGSSLSSKTLLATYLTSSGINTAGYNNFASESAFAANINKTGYTRMLVASSRHRLADAPTSGFPAEYVGITLADSAGTTADPKLVITHDSSVPATVTPAVMALTTSHPSSSRSLGGGRSPALFTFATTFPAASVLRTSTSIPAVAPFVVAIPATGKSTVVNRSVSVFGMPLAIPQAAKALGAVREPAVAAFVLSIPQAGRTLSQAPIPATFATTLAIPAPVHKADSSRSPNVFATSFAVPLASRGIGTGPIPVTATLIGAFPATSKRTDVQLTQNNIAMVLAIPQAGLELVPSLSMLIRMGVPA